MRKNGLMLENIKKEKITASLPSNVVSDMKNLLEWYDNITDKTIEDIIEFHVKFERIHPFQDEDEPLEQKATYLQKCLQNKGFTENSKSFFYKNLMKFI